MYRPVWMGLLLVSCFAAVARAQSPGTLVLPFRSVGVSDTTVAVCRVLLENDLSGLGVKLTRASSADLPAFPDACADVECATEIGQRLGATQVVYGSLSKLGDKIIVYVGAVRVGETAPHYQDQLTSTTEEDLDTVMLRFAEGIAAGRANADRATVRSVTQEEAKTPSRRATRRGFGFRAGFLFPDGGSYAESDRLTSLRLAYKYETHEFAIETTTVLGLAFGDSQIDWTILDLSAVRIVGEGDVAAFFGAGVGVHSIRLERDLGIDPYGYEDYDFGEQSATVPTVDLIAGVITLRTYDFEIIAELRYHYSFEDFEKVGGEGAHGLLLTFGTSR